MKITAQNKPKISINQRYRLKYHMSAPYGWMNDPNGLVFFKGYYHVFYQFNPYASSWGPTHWGHFRSKDLIHWESLPLVLIPGKNEDSEGCFSGSAIVKDDCLYLMYTGHHCNPEDASKFCETQNIAYSTDGLNFNKYKNNPVIRTPPRDNTHNFRDPKIWRHSGSYYVILGGQTKEKTGRAIVYRSQNLFEWKYLGPITVAKSATTQGTMWECPDLFNLGNASILLFSPQGIQPINDEFLNLYQTGYFIGDMNYQNNKFKHGNFIELDHGHDFYAAQTLLAPDGRRILLGWLGMWETAMPEKKDNWAGALTVPRELALIKQHLFMRPVRELQQLRNSKLFDINTQLLSQKLDISDPQHVEITLSFLLKNWHGNSFTFALQNSKDNFLTLTFCKNSQKITLYRKGIDPYRYGQISYHDKFKLQVLIDTSSIEFFVNDGETVFSERYYTENEVGISLRFDISTLCKLQAYSLKTQDIINF
ncbi:glycoside hydrolase family 32 protein [Liquorilactobacillus satsumensis]|uniref:glycoside hydrolase family 32 protein n=1 Tax=Liquorilactobacillus satsumensis TaxID=259059 RepID=UPI0021C369F7|nr:sucrose-6-phosphate hydrolase [Liquorilactobacillus satsumensis]MCP9329116.1 sucrose-6-phosphate hydrolase [Liquorilactobacillus satsumensis]